MDSFVITNFPLQEKELRDYITRPTMTKILKNSLESKPRYLNILTGFFTPKVWRIIGNEISNLTKTDEQKYSFRIVIGREVSKFDPQELQRKFAEELADAEFELAPYIRNLIFFIKRNDVGIKLLKHPFMHGKLYLFPKMAIVLYP